MPLYQKEIKKLEYPKNLAKVVLDEDMENYPEDFEDGVEKALSMIRERESTIIKKVFMDHMTLSSIANEFGITAGRVREIRDRGLCRLRHPTRVRYIKFGLQAVEDENNRIFINKNNILNMSIADLELPLRAYNCLRRSTEKFIIERDNITRYDISRLNITIIDSINMLNDNIYVKNIRNCGVKTGNEIITKFKDIGIIDLLSETAKCKLSYYNEV